MRKFMFSALACVAFAGSAFASNEVNCVDDDTNYLIDFLDLKKDSKYFNKPCKIEVRAIDREGNSVTKYAGGLGNVSLSDCDGIRSRFEEDLRADGYTFDSETDVTLIWGY